MGRNQLFSERHFGFWPNGLIQADLSSRRRCIHYIVGVNYPLGLWWWGGRGGTAESRRGRHADITVAGTIGSRGALPSNRVECWTRPFSNGGCGDLVGQVGIHATQHRSYGAVGSGCGGEYASR